MDVIPYSGGLSPEEPAKLWCLFMIDVKNLYGQPFEVTFERVQDGEHSECLNSYVLKLLWQTQNPRLPLDL